MADHIKDPERAHQLLVETAQDLVPGADDPAEPFWVLVGVTDARKATGGLLCLRGRGTAFFLSRKNAEQLVANMPPPRQELLGRPTKVHWEVRGVSRAMLKRLREDALIRKDGAFVVEKVEADGRMECVPLPMTEEDQAAYDAEKVQAYLSAGMQKLMRTTGGE